ncbi:unnamed protein product [Linum tenue]|uniref:Uncharacterized protein n=1 Tax=Linum tenue TaxID=586396 RepID=A0AAV0RQM0_9ROSI|nr:unnamed protein product [Linum tenue]
MFTSGGGSYKRLWFLQKQSNDLMSRLRAQLEPFRYIVDETTPWEEKSAAVRLSEKLLKSKRNKRWRKRKRKLAAEMHAKVESMNAIAKLKAKEERKRLESELELVLMVEKLQELRSLRIQKLKKQGHFLPEEDDKFLEKVQAAAEEEERLAQAAADTDAAKDAIATALESRKSMQSNGSVPKEAIGDVNQDRGSPDQTIQGEEKIGSAAESGPSGEKPPESHSYGGAFNTVENLPIEFYHYYHGSSNDMGTLIEVILSTSVSFQQKRFSH